MLTIYLNYLKASKSNSGFTLIELLVVIILIGILSAIALPSFLNQASKARQSEAKTNVGALNRAQQTYYLENQVFADKVVDLGVGITATENYEYSSVAIGDLTSGVANKAKANNADLKGYAGGVFKDAATGTTNSILCEVKVAGIALPVSPDSASACDDTQEQL